MCIHTHIHISSLPIPTNPEVECNKAVENTTAQMRGRGSGRRPNGTERVSNDRVDTHVQGKVKADRKIGRTKTKIAHEVTNNTAWKIHNNEHDNRTRKHEITYQQLV